MEVILCEVEHNHFQFSIHNVFFTQRHAEEKAASPDTAPLLQSQLRSWNKARRGERRRRTPPVERRR